MLCTTTLERKLAPRSDLVMDEWHHFCKGTLPIWRSARSCRDACVNSAIGLWGSTMVQISCLMLLKILQDAAVLKFVVFHQFRDLFSRKLCRLYRMPWWYCTRYGDRFSLVTKSRAQSRNWLPSLEMLSFTIHFWHCRHTDRRGLDNKYNRLQIKWQLCPLTWLCDRPHHNRSYGSRARV